MACTETFATLRIFSEDIHPEEITEILGAAPTGTDPRNLESRYKSQRLSNYWQHSTEKLSDSLDNVEHLDLIVNALKGKDTQLKLLRQRGCKTDVFCYWVSNGQGGPRISVDLMKELVNFGLGIYWDMYFDDEEDA